MASDPTSSPQTESSAQRKPEKKSRVWLEWDGKPITDPDDDLETARRKFREHLQKVAPNPEK